MCMTRALIYLFILQNTMKSIIKTHQNSKLWFSRNIYLRAWKINNLINVYVFEWVCIWTYAYYLKKWRDRYRLRTKFSFLLECVCVYLLEHFVMRDKCSSNHMIHNFDEFQMFVWISNFFLSLLIHNYNFGIVGPIIHIKAVIMERRVQTAELLVLFQL